MRIPVTPPLLCSLALAAAAAADEGQPATHASLPARVQVAKTTVRLDMVDARDVRFSRLSRSQGLSQTRVTRIVEDDQGFIWFATQYGLNRYDGYRFRVFKHDPARPDSVCGVYIQSLFKDRAGTLWVGCDYELDRYDPAHESFIHYPIDRNLSIAGLGVSIRHISQDAAGMLWLSTLNGLYRLDPRSAAIRRYRHSALDPLSLSSDEVYSTGQDRAGNLWVANAAGLDEFRPETGQVSLHVPLPEPRELSFYEDRTGTFWVFYASGSGLAVLDRQRGELTRYSFSQQDLPGLPLTGVSSMLEDRSGALWLGTFSDGLLRYDRERGRFLRYRNDPTNSDSLPEDRVTTLTEDREGNVWVGLGATEPSYFVTPAPSFSALPFDWRNSANLGEKLVNAIYEDRDGLLWIGTTGALNRLDRKNGRSGHFSLGPAGTGSDVLSIVEDRAGTLWAGTSGQGLARFDRRTGAFKMYRHIDGDAASLSNDTVPGLFLDRAGTLWAATLDGLDEVDTADGRFVSYRHSSQRRAAGYMSVAQGAHGELWIGADTVGLIRFDPLSHGFEVFSKPQLGDVRANAVYVARSGTVWIATQDGLSGMDPESGTFTHYSEKDGLASNAVSCILEDDRGNLWMGTTEGLSRLTPGTKVFKNYSRADGLPGLDLTGWSACSRSASGEMFFGGFAGAVAFRPDEIADSTYVPRVALTSFELSGVPVALGADAPLRRAIDFTDALTLPHDRNSFSFEFAALTFRSPATNRYRYRLDGLDTGWHEVGSEQRQASYTTLPPGRYVFRVQGALSRGPWSEPGRRVEVTILPPWWATWWFRAVAAGVVLVALWIGYRGHLRRITEEFEIRLAERVGERTRIARELHDSLLQGFQGLMFRLWAIRDLLPDRSAEAATALETALERGEATITDAREAVQDLRSSSLVGGSLEHTLKDLGEELTSKDTSFRVVVEGRPRELTPLLRDESYRIAREAFRNAARHSNARNIEAEVEYGEASFSLRVRDDGQGIDREVLARGRRAGHWGLQGMRERAEHLGGRLNVWSGERRAGTEVELVIPAAIAYGPARGREPADTSA